MTNTSMKSTFQKRLFSAALILSAFALTFSACKTLPQPLKNGLAYFNTYYNANRLMVVSEDEFFLYDEQQRTTPRIIVIEEPTLLDDKPDDREVPQFIKSLVVKPEKLDKARIWIDSVLIKGSKLLVRHTESELIDQTLYLMAKAYFYRSEWHNSQMKCQELIDNYPYSKLSPDAHLILAETLLMQTKFSQAEKALLRAIDIAWGQHRYDALSEAFRIQAELAMHFSNLEDAVKPYRRAITQADDRVQQSRWQLEIGLLYYRKRQFGDAVKEFTKVLEFAPDALTRFEAELYKAASLAQLGRFNEAEKAFKEVLANRNFAEWRSFSYSEYIAFLRLSTRPGIDSIFALTDTLKFKEAPATARYRQALDLFKQHEYDGAQSLFAKSLVETAPTYFYGSLYARLLTDWKTQMPEAVNSIKFYTLLRSDTAAYTLPAQDSARRIAANNIYRIGRIHERLGMPDSAARYYQAAVAICPDADTNRARYLYAEAAVVGLDRHAAKASSKVANRVGGTTDSSEAAKSRLSDSLLKTIVRLYPLTQQGIDARIRLGYTEQFLVDSLADIMQSADRFRQIKQYSKAMQKYNLVAGRYADSKYAPRAFYAQGWLYERELGKRDSAVYWYSRLVEKYPQSSFAQDVKPSLDALLQERRLQDSLKSLPKLPVATSSTMATLQTTGGNTSLTTTGATVQTGAPMRRRQ
ncbi:MAG: tetratricopeptide repeat protein [Ignavibacteria bacterium]|nr:tetratricopeptide repeat protein [Ignavibacteria bacterium]